MLNRKFWMETYQMHLLNFICSLVCGLLCSRCSISTKHGIFSANNCKIENALNHLNHNLKHTRSIQWKLYSRFEHFTEFWCFHHSSTGVIVYFESLKNINNTSLNAAIINFSNCFYMNENENEKNKQPEATTNIL